MGIGREQRFSRRRPCPICAGYDDMPRGKGARCGGYIGSDGEYAHCSRPELAGALELEKGGTYAHRLRGGDCKCGTTHDMRASATAASSSSSDPPSKIVATYDYTDEEGALLHQTVRKDPKKFLQRHRNGGREWVWNLKGVRVVLYRLAELVADDADRTVTIVEGEKDADALAAKGYLATCNPMGAGKWGLVAELAKKVLAGRNVVIIADGDEVGRAHAHEVAASLRGVARRISVWECDGHKDVSDMLAAGVPLAATSFKKIAPVVVDENVAGFAASLTPSTDSEPPKPSAASPLAGLPELAKVAVLGAARIRELASRPVVYLWRDIAIAGIITVIAGGAGSGKTTLLFLVLAARLMRGEPVKVLGREITPIPAGKYIVLVEGEHSDTSASRKLVRSCQLLGVDESALDRVILVARRAVRIGSPAWQDVEKLIAAGLVSDVALDTLARVAPGEENSEAAQVAIFDRLAQAVERAPDPETRPVVWVVAHKRKGEGVDLDDVAGSMQRVGQADTVLMVVAERSDGRVTASKVTFSKLREDPEEWPAPVTYVVKKDAVVTVDAPEQDDRALEVRILERIDAFGPQTAGQLRKELGRNDPDVQAAISTLYAAREIQSTTITIRGREYKAHARRVRRPGEVPS